MESISFDPTVSKKEGFIISHFSFEVRETVHDLALPIIVVLGFMVGGAIGGSFLPGFGNAIGALAGALTGVVAVGTGTHFFIGNKLEAHFFTQEEIEKKNTKREAARQVNECFDELREIKNLFRTDTNTAKQQLQSLKTKISTIDDSFEAERKKTLQNWLETVESNFKQKQ